MKFKSTFNPMKNVAKLSIAVFTVALAGTACKKYEEGPAFSLRPKDERVANTWVVDKAYEGGEENTDEFEGVEIYFSEDGGSEIRGEAGPFGIETTGTWEFSDDKEELIVDYENDSYDDVYMIQKLKENEMWLRRKDDGQELQLKPL
jgi:hypothetical protein